MNLLHLTLLLLTIIIKLFLAETKDRNIGLFMKFEGYFLKAKVFRENKVHLDFECGMHCARYKQCLSYNFASKADQEGYHSCQLLKTNGGESQKLLSDSTEFHHFKRIEVTNFVVCVHRPGFI